MNILFANILFAANGFADAVGRDFTPGAKAAESTRALQAAEKLDSYSGKRQGTTSVVPQMQQNKRRALQAAEKGLNPGQTDEKHTSGAKARVDSVAFVPGINPWPTARRSFSATCFSP